MKNGPDIQKTLGKNIRIRRKRMRLSQEKLGEMADVSRNCISDLEAGNNFIGSDLLARLAIALKTEVYELFKPDNVLPDKSADIIAKYGDQVKEAVEKVGNYYMENVKK